MENQIQLDPNITVAVISTLGGVIIAYITVKYKDRILKKVGMKPPRDRMETIFDGYEKLIKQQQSEIDRKGRVIESLESVVDRLEEELAKTRELLNEARKDLSDTRQQNEDLKVQLTRMKEEYTSP